MVDDVVMIQIMVNHWLLIIDFTKKNENDDLQSWNTRYKNHMLHVRENDHNSKVKKCLVIGRAL